MIMPADMASFSAFAIDGSGHRKFINMRFTPCQLVEMLFICQSPFRAARSRMDAWISLKCNPCKRVRLCELLAPVPVLSGCLSVNGFGLLSSLVLFISQFPDGLGFRCSKPPPSLPLRQQHPWSWLDPTTPSAPLLFPHSHSEIVPVEVPWVTSLMLCANPFVFWIPKCPNPLCCCPCVWVGRRLGHVVPTAERLRRLHPC